MKQEELKLNGTHQFLAYADDVNIVGKNIDTVLKTSSSSLVLQPFKFLLSLLHDRCPFCSVQSS
jgi:hypothetical protein